MARTSSYVLSLSLSVIINNDEAQQAFGRFRPAEIEANEQNHLAGARVL
jgi:hypothetical protein